MATKSEVKLLVNVLFKEGDFTVCDKSELLCKKDDY